MTEQSLESLPHLVFENLQRYHATKKLVIAYSGGIDSTVLLHIVAQLVDAGLVSQIRAVHINHAIQSSSDDWQHHCQLICQQQNIPLITHRLALNWNGQTNIENRARDARYQFFQQILGKDEHLLMAHHQNDQAETLLFRLLRGCGVSGAGAIPESRPLGHGQILRPMLSADKRQVEDYAASHALSWIEDPSNQDAYFSRNFLRQRVFPLLAERWPHYAKTLARFTRLATEQTLLLREIAEQDALLCCAGNAVINLAQLASLSVARQKNLLYFWGASHSQSTPSSQEIDELLRQLKLTDDIQSLAAQKQTTDLLLTLRSLNIDIAFAGQRVRTFAGNLYLTNIQPDAQFKVAQWDLKMPRLTLSNQVTLSYQRINGNGLRLPLADEMVIVKPRAGGEKCRPDYRNHSTNLKNIYQELNIPPWIREWLPVIYYNDVLAAVPGVFINQALINSDDNQQSLRFIIAA
ncbi:tRNA lysidine(34) synthetase TilS [Aliikangiella maris]|uniref:tRNA(Ile)-lysidine synthase n=2 Tax=Aliikangiella maris TaxID=3162458 RepID=A0ABV3MMY4_9GAMM